MNFFFFIDSIRYLPKLTRLAILDLISMHSYVIHRAPEVDFSYPGSVRSLELVSRNSLSHLGYCPPNFAIHSLQFGLLCLREPPG